MGETEFAPMIYSERMTATTDNVNESLLEKWRPFRGPFSRWPQLSDTVLAIVSFFLTIAIWASARPADDMALSFGAFVLFVLGNASLFWRRRYPERVHGTVLAISLLAMLFGYLRGPIFALAISLYNLGRYAADDRDSAVGLAAAIALLLFSEIVFQGFVL